MIKNTLGLLLLLSFFAFPVQFISANEINYATVEKRKEDEISIRYKGPAGERYFVCNIETFDCQQEQDTSPNFTPEILGKSSYQTSPDGKYGIIDLGAGTNQSLLIIYDLSQNTPAFKTILPYQKPVSRALFSPLSSDIFLFGPDGEIFRYGIESRRSNTIKASQADYPQRIISPNGKYVSAYNYTREEHLIWNIDNGEEVSIPGESPSYVEFSENEKHAIFTDTKTAFDSLYLKDLSNNSDPVLISGKDATVIDYLFVNNDIYYISNEDAPYDWNLYKIDPNQNEQKEKIYENVSHGDFMMRAQGRLLFLAIEGKNTNVAIYNPTSGETEVLRPAGSSPLSTKVKRSILEDDGIYSALLEPANSSDDEETLFVWLHGGPQRQTSPAYHSYLSYAVYDELLDRLVESGATVLKLDYTGSFGYGRDFIEDLEKNVGNTDVEDVLEAAEEMVDSDDFDRVFLIGNSYGGYLSMRTLVEAPGEFRGAIGINGVYDWRSLMSRIPSSPLRSLFGGVPTPANAELYEEADIVSRLDELGRDDDILLFLSEKDSTVPTWQTREFAQELEKKGLDYEVVPFPDENHVLTERKTLNTLCKKIMDWVNLDDKVCRN